MLYHQERRTDIEGPHVPAACEGVAAAPGEMARITGHRSTVPATLSRSSHERAFPRSVRKTNRNCPRNEALFGGTRLRRSRDANFANHRWRCSSRTRSEEHTSELQS